MVDSTGSPRPDWIRLGPGLDPAGRGEARPGNVLMTPAGLAWSDNRAERRTHPMTGGRRVCDPGYMSRKTRKFRTDKFDT